MDIIHIVIVLVVVFAILGAVGNPYFQNGTGPAWGYFGSGGLMGLVLLLIVLRLFGLI